MPKKMLMGKRERKRIWLEAVNAAQAAADGAKPVPMVVQERAHALDDRSPVVRQWEVSDGVCGFAWVRLKGTSAMGRWLKQQGHATAAHPSGLMVSAYRVAPREVRQSLTRAEAAVRAAVAVFREHGIECWSESRID